MGVRRAVEMVLDIQRETPPRPVVTYGPLIHNPQTLQLLESKGIRQIDRIDDIQGGTVIIRAHGISPQERLILEQKSLRIVDATCPRVMRVQAIIRKHASRGDFCVIIGDEDHPEVRGLIGFGSAGALAIPSVHSTTLMEIIPKNTSLCVVAQTTQQIETFKRVVDLIKQNHASIEIYNTICDSTKKRQAEVSLLARNVDMIVVVGGKGSGNTQRLLKVADDQGVKAIHVEQEEELTPSAFSGMKIVGVTAGASTPNWQILGVIDRIRKIGMSGKSGILAALRRSADIIVMTYLWAAFGGAGLTAACLVLQGQPVSFLPPVVTMLFVFSMHLLNRIQDRSGAVRFNTPQIASFYSKHRTLLTAAALVSSLGCVLLSYLVGTWTCVLLVSMLITGGFYTADLIPASHLPSMKWRSLKDLPGSKTPLVAAGWGMSAAVLPVIGSGSSPLHLGVAVSFVFAAGFVFWRTALSDLSDMQGDRIVGRETIPILLGARGTSRLLLGLLLFLTLLLAASSLLGWVTRFGFILIFNILIFGILFLIYQRRPPVDRLVFEGMVDGNFVLAGVLALVMGF